MRLIFLDFDGVVVTARSMARAERVIGRRLARGEAYDRIEDGPLWIDRDAVRRLNRIVAATGAYIVVSSSWRLTRSVTDLSITLAGAGCRGVVVGKTPRGPGAWACALADTNRRGAEIAEYLSASERVTGFVILDDDCDMGTLAPWLVQTDTFSGLREADVAAAVAVLRGAVELVPPACGSERPRIFTCDFEQRAVLEHCVLPRHHDGLHAASSGWPKWGGA